MGPIRTIRTHTVGGATRCTAPLFAALPCGSSPLSFCRLTLLSVCHVFRFAMATVATAGVQHCAHVVRLQIRVRIDVAGPAARCVRTAPNHSARPSHPPHRIRIGCTFSTGTVNPFDPVGPAAAAALVPPLRLRPSLRSLFFFVSFRFVVGCSCLLHLFCGTLLSFVFMASRALSASFIRTHTSNFQLQTNSSSADGFADTHAVCHLSLTSCRDTAARMHRHKHVLAWHRRTSLVASISPPQLSTRKHNKSKGVMRQKDCNRDVFAFNSFIACPHKVPSI